MFGSNRRRAGLAARTLVAALAIAAPAIAAPGVARAQGDGGPRWDAFTGCWRGSAGVAAAPRVIGDASTSGARGSDVRLTGGPVVCVVPTSNPSVVEVATVSGGKLVARDSIVANGVRIPRAREGCTGWERAAWSPDGERVYLGSRDRCPHGIEQSGSGILAITPGGEWVDVQGVTVRGNTSVRVARYRATGIPDGLPADLAARLRVRRTPRMAAGARIGEREVIEASRALDPAVTEAWLLASGQRFSVDAHTLVALADAGVPGRVTDALVALSYPRAFALAGEAGTGASIERARPAGSTDMGQSAYSSGRTIPVFLYPFDYSPYGYDAYYGFGSLPYGYSPYGYSPYGYSPYGYGYSPYGYMPYGGWYAPPVIVLRGSQPGPSGRVVAGQGYTQDTPGGTTRTARPRSPAWEPPPRASSSPPQGSPPPAPAPVRTAHPRP